MEGGWVMMMMDGWCMDDYDGRTDGWINDDDI